MGSVFTELPDWLQILILLSPAGGATIAGVGLILNALETARARRQEKAAMITGCLRRFTDDECIQEAFYLIEYSEFKYPAEFHGSEAESKIDKLLQNFASIAFVSEAGLLDSKDVMPLKYYLIRVCQNPEIERYLDYIRD